MTKRIFALLLCAATLFSALAFTGCSNQGEEDKGQYITAYLPDNVYDLDPARAYQNEALANIVGLMFDTLFKLDEYGNVQKSLVKKYVIEENEAANEYKMQIYLNDTYWSDGTAISANDIRFAWLRLLEVDANFEAASLLFDIKNARAAKEGDVSIDDVQIYAAEQQMLEVYFEGKIDYDHFIFNLTSLALAPLREDVVSKGDDWAKKPGTMVCSGPFKLGRINVKTLDEKYYDENHQYKDSNGFNQVGRKESRQVVTDFILERNAYYYRDYEEDALKKSVTPYRICVDCSLSDEQLAAMYEAGMIMYISDIPVSLRKEGSIAKDVKVADTSMSTNSIYLNQNAIIDNGKDGEKLFANKTVRQALSMVIDRNTIAGEVVYAEAATGLVPTGVYATGDDQFLYFFHKSFRDQVAADAYATLQTNTEAAKKLLDDAGINPRKYSFELTCAAYDEVHCLIADKVAEAWCELGFNVTVRKIGTIQNNDYYKYTDSVPPDICDDLYADELRLGTFDAIILDYVAYSADPFSVLSSFAKPFSGRGMDMSNPDEYKLTPHITGYDSAEYNQLIEDIFAEKTIKNRADNLLAAEAMLMDDMPIIPIVFNLNATVTSSKLTGEKTNYYGTLNFQKCKISSYSKYLEAGNKYISEHFGELKFYESNDCSFRPVDDTPENILAALDLFKSSNTVYMQFFLED